MRKRWVAAMLGAGWMSCGAAIGDYITPTEQTRFIEGVAEVVGPELSDSDYQSASAADFGPFVDGVTALATVAPFEASGAGTQDSSILADSIVGVGSSAASGTGSATTFSNASGSSTCSVTFTLNSDADYSLTGSISSVVSGASGGTAGIALYDSLANVVESIEVNDTGFDSILASGSLLSGSYTLYAFALSSAGTDFENPSSTSSAEYDFNLTFTPEPSSLALLGLTALFVARRRR